MKMKMGMSTVVMGVAALALGLGTSIHSASGACMLEPSRSTNNVGQVRAVTATVTTNGNPAAGVFVSFTIISGPNVGVNGASSTDTNGQTTFSYTGTAAGTNILQASGSVGGAAFTCLATQIWRSVPVPPTITCPGNVITNAAADGCSRSVAFAAVASGSPMPTVRCRIGAEAITSPHIFPAGTTTVTCVASNANGTSSCSFTVTVTESEPPAITCVDVFAGAVPGEGSAVVTYDLPEATDNCGPATVVCDPPSGSTFLLGATTVNCTATDSAQNTNSCFFTVFVEEVFPEAHDLAVVKIKAPRVVNLSGRLPVVTKKVVVTIQNRSPHIETISDLASLVTLTVESLDPNLCPDIVPLVIEGRPQRRLPVNLRPRQKLNVYFNVTFDCAINPAKGLGQEDFRYTARVHHEALEGAVADTHPECDVCPRPPLEGFFDPNPNGRIRDKGCGAPVGDGTFGNDVLTDVVYR